MRHEFEKERPIATAVLAIRAPARGSIDAQAKAMGISVRDDAPDVAGTPAWVDPREVMHQVRERVRAAAEAKNVDVLAHCRCGSACVQPLAFSEALYELVGNAVQATRRGYPVFVDVCETGEGELLWRIQDEGEGAGERDSSQPGHASEAVCPEGSSPRVARVSSLIEEHGGVLRFESAPRVGTTAIVWVPTRGGPRDRA